ncbi:MAG: recombination protein O N-terminal domain-containing protein [Candidatus Colwellbacteria bacterium]|nr:recombination protein O N-terminal domain-containing protein [Candidatus Colwellbacteria bacterium]
MTEHFTWGVVLSKNSIGEADSEYSIFTWDLGKVRARATSSRKITSKLAGHLEPGTFASVRLVRKSIEGRFRIIEALRESKIESLPLIKVFDFADKLIPLEEPDLKMFSFFKKAVFSGVISEAKAYSSILKMSGFDPDTARCGICGSRKIAYFSPQDIMFLCLPCLERRNNLKKE